MSAAGFSAPARRVGWFSLGALRKLEAHGLLLVGLMYYSFVGTHPLSETSAEGRVDGSPADRIYVLAMFGIALYELWRCRAVSLALAKASWVLLAVIGFCCLSIVWSDYPDLTLRRAILFVFLSVAAMGVAVGVKDLRQFHTTIFVCFVAIILFNLIMVATNPVAAISGIGVRGIYTQKNVAGMVTMIATVVSATWLLDVRSRTQLTRGLAAVGMMFVFLVFTRSKTSLGLAVVTLSIVGMFALAERNGARFAVIALSGMLAVAALVLGWFASIDFDIGRAMEVLLGDASFTGRDDIWAFAWKNVLKRPLLGHGYGAFWDVGLVNDPIAKLEKGTWLGDTEVGEINQAHNGYLELSLHIGVPATAIAVATVLFVAVFGAKRAISGKAGRGDRAAAAAMAAILFLYLTHNYTEATLFMRGSPFSNFAMLALFLIARVDALFARSRSAGARRPDVRPQAP